MTREHLGWGEALGAVALSYLMLVTLGGFLVGKLGPAGQGIVEVALVLGPAIAFCVVGGVRVRAGLGLVRPSLRALLGGLVAGAGACWLVACVVEPWMERVLPLPPALREELRRRIVPDGGPRPLALDLVTLALLPALCEESLFRGVLLGALVADAPRTRAARWGAVVVTALGFGVYHGRVWLILPTGLLGIALGAIALRARSTVPAMVLHATNNAIVLAMVRAGLDEGPQLGTRDRALAGVAAVVATGLGLVIARPMADKTR